MIVTPIEQIFLIELSEKYILPHNGEFCGEWAGSRIAQESTILISIHGAKRKIKG